MHEEQVIEKEKYILVAVASKRGENTAWESLEELQELLRTAGAEASSMVVQNLEHPERATYVGSGKVLELKEMLEQQGAVGIVCDDELTPSQMRNLSDRLDAKVLDRTLLILDIFASHAKTREGKIQVEIAQLRYRASRLRGIGEAMSRLGAGIGTRGPGETKLESDRRVIQNRIKLLSDEIESMKQVRATTRKKRSESPVPTVAIVGYTNAGKSTLINRLTESDVLSENMLFATLDPTTRTAILPDSQEVLMTDTVGFINKLPHHLVDAFRSTLEEAKYADIILHVVDASNPQSELQRKVANDTLEDLGVVGKPVITAWNKIDLVEEANFKDFEADRSVQISAKTGQGIDELFEALSEILSETRSYIDTVISYADSSKLALIRKYGQIIEEKYEGDGIHVKAYAPKSVKL
ncbi:MAG: GTPase HflX [Firmicutes bacterium]|nr:GTPase HflX [Bacillota bacterium]